MLSVYPALKRKASVINWEFLGKAPFCDGLLWTVDLRRIFNSHENIHATRLVTLSAEELGTITYNWLPSVPGLSGGFIPSLFNLFNLCPAQYPKYHSRAQLDHAALTTNSSGIISTSFCNIGTTPVVQVVRTSFHLFLK